jgi:hypothetical protein
MESLFGVLIVGVGIFIFIKSKTISETLQARNDGLKESYNRKFQNVKGIKRLFIFLFVDSGSYYETEKETKNVLLFLSPFIILFGIVIILIGLGIKW